MAKTKSWNPIAFRPLQVTLVSVLLYAVLLVLLLLVHHSLPAAPDNASLAKGINLTETWIDLQAITRQYRPWGSRYNDVTKRYLLERVEEILKRNGAEYRTVFSVNNTFMSEVSEPSFVTIFANDTANFTSRGYRSDRPWTVYGESDNILVYIRGQEEADWWNETSKYEGSSGTLMNAHFDSVPTGFGATDDGMGVVTILQLISYFTTDGQRPRRGVVALLNNGEEMGLYGAQSYIRHPLSQLPHTFLNLEGAGAGGRATLFGSTDVEVTRAYSKSPYPFGSIVSGDGFKQGFIRSGTDYTPLTNVLGMRGLDVAFFAPRSRYHTAEDDARGTSLASVSHMLSAALAVMQHFTSYVGDEFEGPIDRSGKFKLRSGSDAVWFDMFGRAFAVLQLNELFGISVALLCVVPIAFVLLEMVLRRNGKWYPFSRRICLQPPTENSCVQLHGFRGFFRFPIAFIFATGVDVALALLLTKINPYILYSSEYAVWAMLLCAWLISAWLVLAGAASMRPTALQRMHVLLWLYIGFWIALVVATIGEHDFHLGSGYFIVVYNVSVSVALLISYLELLGLPQKTKYAEHVLGAMDDTASARPRSVSSGRPLQRTLDAGDTDGDNGHATETTSLLRGRGRSVQTNTTFTHFSRRRHHHQDDSVEDADDQMLNRAYPKEQAWSSSLPQWTWGFQLILLAPINVIIVGQIALLVTSALHQTLSDGNDVLPIYLMWTILAVLILLPLSPFLHRFTYHVPLLLTLIFGGCLIYNLTAFPFSRNARLKFYFLQELNLDTGVNEVSLLGVDGYLQSIAAELPSTAGQHVKCDDALWQTYSGLRGCRYHGLHPILVPDTYRNSSDTLLSKPAYQSWLNFNITHKKDTASFALQGLNTKLCRIDLDNKASHIQVEDAASDPRMEPVGPAGTSHIYLASRTWDKTFMLNITWQDMPAKGQKGRVVCIWSDANQPGVIPAFDEILKYQPVWSIVVGVAGHTGLVEAFKEFTI